MASRDYFGCAITRALPTTSEKIPLIGSSESFRKFKTNMANSQWQSVIDGLLLEGAWRMRPFPNSADPYLGGNLPRDDLLELNA